MKTIPNHRLEYQIIIEKVRTDLVSVRFKNYKLHSGKKRSPVN